MGFKQLTDLSYLQFNCFIIYIYVILRVKYRHIFKDNTMAKKDITISVDKVIYKHFQKGEYWTPELIAKYLTRIYESEIEEGSVSFYAEEAIKLYKETNEIPEKDKPYFQDHELDIYKFITFTSYLNFILADLWENNLLRTIYNEFNNRMDSYLFVEEYMQLQQFSQERFKEYNLKKIDLWLISRMGFRKFIFDKLFSYILDERARIGLVEGVDHTTNFRGYMKFVEKISHNIQETEHYTLDNLINILGVKKELILNYLYWDLDITWKDNAVKLFNNDGLTFGEIMTTLSFDGKNDCFKTLQPKELAFYLNFDYDNVLEYCSVNEILKLTNLDIQNFKSTGKLKASTIH